MISTLSPSSADPVLQGGSLTPEADVSAAAASAPTAAESPKADRLEAAAPGYKPTPDGVLRPAPDLPKAPLPRASEDDSALAALPDEDLGDTTSAPSALATGVASLPAAKREHLLRLLDAAPSAASDRAIMRALGYASYKEAPTGEGIFGNLGISREELRAYLETGELGPGLITAIARAQQMPESWQAAEAIKNRQAFAFALALYRLNEAGLAARARGAHGDKAALAEVAAARKEAFAAHARALVGLSRYDDYYRREVIAQGSRALSRAQKLEAERTTLGDEGEVAKLDAELTSLRARAHEQLTTAAKWALKEARAAESSARRLTAQGDTTRAESLTRKASELSYTAHEAALRDVPNEARLLYAQGYTASLPEWREHGDPSSLADVTSVALAERALESLPKEEQRGLRARAARGDWHRARAEVSALYEEQRAAKPAPAERSLAAAVVVTRLRENRAALGQYEAALAAAQRAAPLPEELLLRAEVSGKLAAQAERVAAETLELELATRHPPVRDARAKLGHELASLSETEANDAAVMAHARVQLAHERVTKSRNNAAKLRIAEAELEVTKLEWEQARRVLTLVRDLEGKAQKPEAELLVLDYERASSRLDFEHARASLKLARANGDYDATPGAPRAKTPLESKAEARLVAAKEASVAAQESITRAEEATRARIDAEREAARVYEAVTHDGEDTSRLLSRALAVSNAEFEALAGLTGEAAREPRRAALDANLALAATACEANVRTRAALDAEAASLRAQAKLEGELQRARELRIDDNIRVSSRQHAWNMALGFGALHLTEVWGTRAVDDATLALAHDLGASRAAAEIAGGQAKRLEEESAALRTRLGEVLELQAEKITDLMAATGKDTPAAIPSVVAHLGRYAALCSAFTPARAARAIDEAAAWVTSLEALAERAPGGEGAALALRAAESWQALTIDAARMLDLAERAFMSGEATFTGAWQEDLQVVLYRVADLATEAFTAHTGSADARLATLRRSAEAAVARVEERAQLFLALIAGAEEQVASKGAEAARTLTKDSQARLLRLKRELLGELALITGGVVARKSDEAIARAEQEISAEVMAQQDALRALALGYRDVLAAQGSVAARAYVVSALRELRAVPAADDTWRDAHARAMATLRGNLALTSALTSTDGDVSAALRALEVSYEMTAVMRDAAAAKEELAYYEDNYVKLELARLVGVTAATSVGVGLVGRAIGIGANLARAGTALRALGATGARTAASVAADYAGYGLIQGARLLEASEVAAMAFARLEQTGLGASLLKTGFARLAVQETLGAGVTFAQMQAIIALEQHETAKLARKYGADDERVLMCQALFQLVEYGYGASLSFQQKAALLKQIVNMARFPALSLLVQRGLISEVRDPVLAAKLQGAWDLLSPLVAHGLGAEVRRASAVTAARQQLGGLETPLSPAARSKLVSAYADHLTEARTYGALPPARIAHEHQAFMASIDAHNRKHPPGSRDHIPEAARREAARVMLGNFATAHVLGAPAGTDDPHTLAMRVLREAGVSEEEARIIVSMYVAPALDAGAALLAAEDLPSFVQNPDPANDVRPFAERRRAVKNREEEVVAVANGGFIYKPATADATRMSASGSDAPPPSRPRPKRPEDNPTVRPGAPRQGRKPSPRPSILPAPPPNTPVVAPEVSREQLARAVTAAREGSRQQLKVAAAVLAPRLKIKLEDAAALIDTALCVGVKHALAAADAEQATTALDRLRENSRVWKLLDEAQQNTLIVAIWQGTAALSEIPQWSSGSARPSTVRVGPKGKREHHDVRIPRYVASDISPDQSPATAIESSFGRVEVPQELTVARWRAQAIAQELQDFAGAMSSSISDVSGGFEARLARLRNNVEEILGLDDHSLSDDIRTSLKQLADDIVARAEASFSGGPDDDGGGGGGRTPRTPEAGISEAAGEATASEGYSQHRTKAERPAERELVNVAGQWLPVVPLPGAAPRMSSDEGETSNKPEGPRQNPRATTTNGAPASPEPRRITPALPVPPVMESEPPASASYASELPPPSQSRELHKALEKTLAVAFPKGHGFPAWYQAALAGLTPAEQKALQISLLLNHKLAVQNKDSPEKLRESREYRWLSLALKHCPEDKHEALLAAVEQNPAWITEVWPSEAAQQKEVARIHETRARLASERPPETVPPSTLPPPSVSPASAREAPPTSPIDILFGGIGGLVAPRVPADLLPAISDMDCAQPPSQAFSRQVPELRNRPQDTLNPLDHATLALYEMLARSSIPNLYFEMSMLDLSKTGVLGSWERGMGTTLEPRLNDAARAAIMSLGSKKEIARWFCHTFRGMSDEQESNLFAFLNAYPKSIDEWTVDLIRMKADQHIDPNPASTKPPPPPREDLTPRAQPSLAELAAMLARPPEPDPDPDPDPDDGGGGGARRRPSPKAPPSRRSDPPTRPIGPKSGGGTEAHAEPVPLAAGHDVTHVGGELRPQTAAHPARIRGASGGGDDPPPSSRPGPPRPSTSNVIPFPRRPQLPTPPPPAPRGLLPRAAEIIAQQKQRLKDAMAAFSWDTPPFHIIPRLLAAEASRIKNSTIMTLFKSTVAGVLESFYLQGMQKALSTTTIERGSDGEPVLLEPQLEILRTADARLRELGLEPKERQEFLLAAISIWAQDAGVDPRPLLQAANVAFVTRFSTNPANDNAAKPD